jgi:hypothetical protein
MSLVIMFYGFVSHITGNHLYKKWSDVYILPHNNSCIKIAWLLGEIDGSGESLLQSLSRRCQR